MPTPPHTVRAPDIGLKDEVVSRIERDPLTYADEPRPPIDTELVVVFTKFDIMYRYIMSRYFFILYHHPNHSCIHMIFFWIIYSVQHLQTAYWI